MSLLEVSKISSSYDNKSVLYDINFVVEAGQLVGILGENGCGKTTLLKCLVGVKEYSGSCCLNLEGETVSLKSVAAKNLPKYLAYMPQLSGISVDITVLDVVLMAFHSELSLFEKPDRSMTERAMASLKLVGLADKADNMFLELSQGQKQLAVLARLLASEGHLLVLDEPESSIDFAKLKKLFKLIKDWNAEKPERCAVVSMHDPALALNMCDRLLLIKNGVVINEINPREDSSEDISAKLSGLYGELCVKEIEVYEKKQFVVLGKY